MDGFFEKYGRVIIIAVAICFVLLYLTPMQNVVGSSINGFAGNFANKVGDSLGTVKMPDGSGEVAKEKSSMIIGFDGSESQFANAIPEQATAVVFTDEVAPKGATTTDLTVAKDGDVVGWLDGTTWKVSTQDPNKAVTFNENCMGMFVSPNDDGENKLWRLTEIFFNNVNTSNTINMQGMFMECGVASLDLSNFDTSNVTDMSIMFAGCIKLQELDLSHFDTSKVTDMMSVFQDCQNLVSLDLSGFNTSQVTDMSHMFYDCLSLTSLDVSSFDTSNVTGMMDMFGHCSSLTSLNVSSFDTSKVEDMYGMFYSCSNLNTLDLSSFDTSNVTDMSHMFYDCSNLTNIYVSPKWSTKKVTNGGYMFDDCKKLPNFDTSLTNVPKAHTGPGGYLTLKA